jgi:biotin carboxyl carrier protein
MTDGAPVRRSESGTDGHVKDAAVRDATSTTTTTDDAGAVRVRLAATSATGLESPMLVAPGAAGAAVSAQRHPQIDGEPRDVELRRASGDRATLLVAGERIPVVIGPSRPGRDRTVSREILVDGFRFEVEAVPERLAALRERATRVGASAGRKGPLEVRAVIPGRVVSVAVAPGDAVVAGQQLLVVEAMKMQNELRAPRDGTIDRVGIAPGVNIEVGDLLVVISQETTA